MALTLRVLVLRRSSWVFWVAEVHPPPFFTLPAPIFLRKVSGKPEESSEHVQKFLKKHKNFAKIVQTFFETLLQQTVFKMFHSYRDNSIAHGFAPRKGPESRNPFAEQLFGLQISQNSVFLQNIDVFPGSFSNLSGKFLQDFSRNSEELEPQDHVGTKIIIRLFIVICLQHQTCA